MRRIFLLVAAVSLLVLPAPGQAQVTADQLNKLSLEALTAPPPRAPAARRSFARSLQTTSGRGYSHPGARRTSYHTRAAHPARHASTARRRQFAHR